MRWSAIAALAWFVALVHVSRASAEDVPRPSVVVTRTTLPAATVPVVQAELERALAALSLRDEPWAFDSECEQELLRRACIEVAMTDPSTLRIVLIDPPTQRIERTLRLTEHGVDSVALEEFSQIVESSLSTLESFPVRAANASVPEESRPVEVPSTTYTTTVLPSPKVSVPRPAVAKSPSPARTPRNFTLGLGYEVASWGEAVWIAGPRASVHWAWRADAPRFGLEVAAWSGVPATEEGAGARASLWPMTLRTALFIEHPITRALTFGAALGVWAGMWLVSADVQDAELRAEGTNTRFDAGMRAAFGVRVHVLPQVSLLLEPTLDLTPIELNLGVERVSGFRSILNVSRIRPGGALSVSVDL